MMYPSKRNSSSLSFLLIGGWTAVKSATLGSMIVVLLNMGIAAIFSIWQNGIHSLRLSGSEFQYFLSAVALLMLLAILFSAFPAFIGGVFLAWLLKRNKPNWLSALQGRLRLGSLIGAFAGIILALSVLVPGDFVGRTAHNGIGYNVYSAIPIYLFYAIEIIFIASVAGTWTDVQLSTQLGVIETRKTG